LNGEEEGVARALLPGEAGEQTMCLVNLNCFQKSRGTFSIIISVLYSFPAKKG
jgi:hypothetical protein